MNSIPSLKLTPGRRREVGIFLIFPSVILVTLGPAVILLYTQMKALVGP